MSQDKIINVEGMPDKEAMDRMGKAVQALNNIGQMMQDFTKYTVALELFNKTKLAMISQLNKEKVETITKFETYRYSMQTLYDLEDNDPSLHVIDKMNDFYRTNQISLKRQARKEIESILKEAQYEAPRSAGRVLIGGNPK